MRTEKLWNGYTLTQPGSSFRLSTDSVVCADFADFPKGSAIADLGCGSGAIAMMLLASDASLHLTGIELDCAAADAAEANAQQCPQRFSVLCGDLRCVRDLLPAGSMDGCISNPPYFPAGSGPEAQGAMAKARSEATLTLSQLTAAAAWLLKTGGRFALVHRPERLADIIWELRNAGLEPKRIRFVRHKASSPVSLVLIEARKGGHPALQYEQDLVLFDENGAETDEYKRIYHR